MWLPRFFIETTSQTKIFYCDSEKDRGTVLWLKASCTAYLITFVFFLAIAFGTLGNSVGSAGVLGADKIMHIIAFACLTFPLCASDPMKIRWVVVGAVAYGALIEIIQPFFGRQAEILDLIADAVGSVLGASLAFMLKRWFQ